MRFYFQAAYVITTVFFHFHIYWPGNLRAIVTEKGSPLPIHRKLDGLLFCDEHRLSGARLLRFHL